jgi:hypothetical protein
MAGSAGSRFCASSASTSASAPWAGRIDEDGFDVGGLWRGCGLLPVRQATSGTAEHLPRAGQALAVRRAQAGGGARVGGGEASVQGGGAEGGEKAARFVPGGLAGIGDVRQAVGQGGEVEAGAAAEDGQAAFGVGAVDRGEGLRAPPCGAAGGGGGTDAVERMWDAGFFGRRGACGEDTQLAVDLHGVGVDDDAAAAFGQGEGERGFAAASGACHDEDGVAGGRRRCQSPRHGGYPF